MTQARQKFMACLNSESVRMADLLPLIRYAVLESSIGEVLFIACLITLLRD